MPTLQYLFLAVAVALFLFWNLTALVPRRAVKAGNVIAVLRYGRALRLFALTVALAIPTLLAILMLRTPWVDPQRLLLAGGTLTVLSLLGGALLLEVERVVITVTDDGLIGDSPWRRRRELRWPEIERITYSGVNRWYAVVGRDGRTIRASAFLVGLPTLLQALQERVPGKYPKV